MAGRLNYHEVVVTPAAESIRVGEQVTLRVKKLPPPGDPSYVAVLYWTSDDTTVATVDSGPVHGTARVLGKRLGTTRVSATLNGFLGAASITVVPANPQ
jgi:uncharacterized protein YjdB